MRGEWAGSTQLAEATSFPLGKPSVLAASAAPALVSYIMQRQSLVLPGAWHPILLRSLGPAVLPPENHLTAFART